MSSQQQTHQLCEQTRKVRREKLAFPAVWVHVFAMMESKVWLQLLDGCADGCVNHSCGSKLFSQYAIPPYASCPFLVSS